MWNINIENEDSLEIELNELLYQSLLSFIVLIIVNSITIETCCKAYIFVAPLKLSAIFILLS
jgi:hypothetical protein